MPVTFQVATHPANQFSKESREVYTSDPLKLLANLTTAHPPSRLLGSSVDGSQNILVKKNGFVWGVEFAYNKHHNLVIRPDDVWIAILSQLNFYINAHAEELRDKFVDHQGKKELVVVTYGTLETVDFGDLTVQMTEKYKSLVPWLLPNFSTTTANDTIICAGITMSTLRAYFEYKMTMLCGIPNITLEGTQSDWQSILDRIEKIPEFGDQPKKWADMLQVILTRFVRAFDEGDPEADKEFWGKMVHYTGGGSGINYLGGWISAFCAWDKDGEFHPSIGQKAPESSRNGVHWKETGVSFDGVWFPSAHGPAEGYSEVDVKVEDVPNRKTYDCTLLAGHVGVALSDQEKLDTVHIKPQWFMYVKGAEVDRAQAARGRLRG